MVNYLAVSYNQSVVKKGRPWTLLSTHGLVLVEVARHPDETVMGIAKRTGLSRTTVLRAIRDLESARMIETRRLGRRNAHRIDGSVRFRHPVMQDARIEGLLGIFRGEGDGQAVPP